MNKRPHLVHEAYASLLRRAEMFRSGDPDERSWKDADRFERHAVNAALDLRDARATIAEQAEQLVFADELVEAITRLNEIRNGSPNAFYAAFDRLFKQTDAYQKARGK